MRLLLVVLIFMSGAAAGMDMPNNAMLRETVVNTVKAQEEARKEEERKAGMDVK